jgi:hypothetical protein
MIKAFPQTSQVVLLVTEQDIAMIQLHPKVAPFGLCNPLHSGFVTISTGCFLANVWGAGLHATKLLQCTANSTTSISFYTWYANKQLTWHLGDHVAAPYCRMTPDSQA